MSDYQHSILDNEHPLVQYDFMLIAPGGVIVDLDTGTILDNRNTVFIPENSPLNKHIYAMVETLKTDDEIIDFINDIID